VNYPTPTSRVSDKYYNDPLVVQNMRRASHNILYTVVNSRAYDAANLHPGMPSYQVIFIVIDIILALLLIVLELTVVRATFKTKKSA
jgi:beta-glucosidase